MHELGPDTNSEWYKKAAAEVHHLSDEELAVKIGELGAQIARDVKDPQIGAEHPRVVMAVRWMEVALGDLHGQSLWHGDHDFDLKVEENGLPPPAG